MEIPTIRILGEVARKDLHENESIEIRDKEGHLISDITILKIHADTVTVRIRETDPPYD